MPNVIASNLIKTHIEHVERLHAERDEVDLAIKDAMDAAKAAGLDMATFRKALTERKKDPTARAEEGASLKLYMDAAEVSA